jgi:hypothetical protein
MNQPLLLTFNYQGNTGLTLPFNLCTFLSVCIGMTLGVAFSP